MVDVLNINNDTAVLCNFHYEQQTVSDEELWCDSVWDSVLCWPRTKASDTAKLQCPLAKGVDPTKFVEKRCGDDGKWEGRNGTQDSPMGWTNYTPCYTSETWFLLRKIYTGNKDAAEVIMEIAENTRTLEFVGLSISVTALLISLAIFCRFRSLRNTRTRIHKNLFVAMAIQVTTRLTLYIDQALMKSAPLGLDHGIHNTPILCKATYVLLEYARTAMFMWMFIEGFFLHNMVTVTVFQETTSYRMYRLIGWGLPVVMTMTWAIVTALYYPFT
ncbi:hypothetical protein PV328_000610 [Microctonus aethiopoides]|uniref:PDF receptor n=1 Tax=Microctonus aethiopoides TaxID=144406 RepID=A0AA39FVH5_9HYME|nr:hypothetical protein PV328_000610 [Microctonus aethiopoides]